MATYTLTTLYKKSTEERAYWFKDGQVIVKIEGYRWGTFTKECDERPDIDLDNEDGIEVYSDEWELVDMLDGCWGEWEWPANMPEKECSRLEALWDEEYYEGLEGEGWIQNETEVWLYGPLLLKNEDSNEEWRGSELQLGLDSDPTPTVEVIEPELTEWFPADINPIHKGCYEIQREVNGAVWPFPTYADWDGKKWRENGKLLKDLKCWRGLAKNPNEL